MAPTHGISDSIGEESFPVSDPATTACIDEHGALCFPREAGASLAKVGCACRHETRSWGGAQQTGGVSAGGCCLVRLRERALAGCRPERRPAPRLEAGALGAEEASGVVLPSDRCCSVKHRPGSSVIEQRICSRSAWGTCPSTATDWTRPSSRATRPWRRRRSSTRLRYGTRRGSRLMRAWLILAVDQAHSCRRWGSTPPPPVG
jgi:hypothetical protein